MVGARARCVCQPLVQRNYRTGRDGHPGVDRGAGPAARSGRPPTGGRRASTRTSATRSRTGSPRSRSTGPRCATRSGPRRWSSSRTRSSGLARTPRWAWSCSPARGRSRSARAATSACAATPAMWPRRRRAVGRFHVTDLHVQMRRLPKPVVAMVAGYAIGGGHVLHVVCDLTIAADNARFGQTGPQVGSFDGGFGASLLAAQLGHKKAKEIWFLCRAVHGGGGPRDGAREHGRPLEELEEETVRWCREMLELSPFSLRLLKASFNAAEDGLAGIQQLAHDANLLFYMSEEAQEGRDAYRGSAGGDFAQVPEDGLDAICGSGWSRRGRARCRRRWRPCWWAPRSRGSEDVFRALALRGGLGGQRVHPDRHEPLQRLLRRAPGRRYRGPARTGAGDRRRPHAAAPGAGGDLRGLRHRCGRRPVPGGGGRLGAAGGGRRLDPRRRALHGRPAALRLRGPGRAVRVPVLRHRRGGRLVLRPDGGAALGGVRPGRARGPAGRGHPRGQQRARHRHRPPRRQAHAGGEARPRANAEAVHGDGRGRLRWCRLSLVAAAALALGAAGLGGAPAGALRWSGPCGTRTDGPALNQALAGPGRLLALYSLLLALGVLLS